MPTRCQSGLFHQIYTVTHISPLHHWSL